MSSAWRWISRLLRVHSPAGHEAGNCWCQLDAHREAQSKGYER